MNSDLLEKLISFKTVCGNDDEFKKCFEFIKNYLSSNKSLIFKEFKYDNDMSMLISNTSDNNYDLLFLGHIDVVPGSDEQFNAVIKDDKLYGRGSFDMKGHDSVMIDLMKNLDTKKKVALILTSDEERGGFHGIPRIMEDSPFHSKLVIVPDGGNNFELVIEEKGVLQLELVSHGKSAHASRPYDGDNAIVKLMNLYYKLIKKYPIPKSGKVYKTSINLGVISGGTVVNIVPGEAKMMLDIRHVYEDDKQSIINSIKEIDDSIDVNIFAQGEAYKLDLENKEVKKYIECCEKVLNKRVKYLRGESASDARFFEKYNMHAIIMNACGNDMHGKNEYIELSSLEKLKHIYDEMIRNI